ncbi:MAG: hypothetical protein KI792_04575 [Alphaproteobacteria bacterium]|nr:hypothetical protein [Alphaproteobacteria bacterium SS10]
MDRVAIYWPAALSFISLVIYIWSMQRFYGGDIPGMEYILAVYGGLIAIPIGAIYFVVAILINLKRPLNNLYDHLRSAGLTLVFGGLTLSGVLRGFIVSV